MGADRATTPSGAEEAGLALEDLTPELAPLAEVPIAVTVRLGHASLSLGDLMKLRAGAVLTLERQVGEPAEIMVGDKVVALGQMVTVGDELGIRVTALGPGERS